MKERTLSQNIFRNSLYNSATTIFSRIGSLIFTVVLARILMPEAFGIYALTISSAFFLLTIIDLGPNGALLKFSANKNSDKSSGYFHYIMNLKMKLSVIASLIILAISYPLSFYVFNKPDVFPPLILASLYIILLSLDSFFSSTFFIFNDVKKILWKEILLQTSRILLILLIPLLFMRSLYVFGVIFILIITSIFGLVFITYYIKNNYNFLFKGKDIDLKSKREVKKFIFYISVGGISAMFLSYIDIFFLGALIPDSSYVGYYRAATTLIFGIAGVLTFTNVLLPKLVQIKKKQLQSSFDKIIKYSVGLSIPAIFGILIIGNYLIVVLYGYEYLQAVYPLFFLSFLIVETVISGTVYSLLAAKGRPEIYMKASIFSFVLNAILNLILITTLINFSLILATVGAAIATLISRFFYTGILIFSAKKHLALKLKISFFIKPILSSIIMYLSLFVFNQFVDMSVFIGIIEIVVGIVIYTGLMFLIKGFDKNDLKIGD